MIYVDRVLVNAVSQDGEAEVHLVTSDKYARLNG